MTSARTVQELVIDADVFVDALVHPREYHSPQPGNPERHAAAPYVEGLKSGDYVSHLPRLSVIETCATVRRVVRRLPKARALAISLTFREWERDGAAVMHDIDEAFAIRAVDAAIRYNLRGADATYVALADALSNPFKTRDGQILANYPGASPP